jgi:hypothetical protein
MLVAAVTVSFFGALAVTASERAQQFCDKASDRYRIEQEDNY